jgi:hypothetical protein
MARAPPATATAALTTAAFGGDEKTGMGSFSSPGVLGFMPLEEIPVLLVLPGWVGGLPGLDLLLHPMLGVQPWGFRLRAEGSLGSGSHPPWGLWCPATCCC